MKVRRRRSVRCPHKHGGTQCVRTLEGRERHPGWCTGGHRFGRPRQLWHPGQEEGHAFQWHNGSPLHYHREAREWRRMEARRCRALDVWACAGCGLHVELPADAGPFGASAWARARQGTEVRA